MIVESHLAENKNQKKLKKLLTNSCKYDKLSKLLLRQTTTKNLDN